jgi:hypothetical protein
MQTKLDKLLEFIDPEKNIVEIYNRANQAVNTCGINTALIGQWDQFRYCMAEFLRHLDFCILRLRKPIDVSSEYYWQRCTQVLFRVYGANGEKAAFEMARTGNESGLYGVLKAVAMQVAEDYSKKGISAKAITYWKGLSVDEQFDVCDEYIAKYGRFLPSEITEGSAARIKVNFIKVLEEHPRLVQRIRSVGR